MCVSWPRSIFTNICIIASREHLKHVQLSPPVKPPQAARLRRTFELDTVAFGSFHFTSLACGFEVIKPSLRPRSVNLAPLFSSMKFTVLGLIFRSLIHSS